MIYFLHSAQQKAVKIGFTSKGVLKRSSAIQTGNPEELILLGILPGDRAEEARLHLLFKGKEIRGEWFRADEDLLALIASMVASNGVAHKRPERWRSNRLKPNGSTANRPDGKPSGATKLSVLQRAILVAVLKAPGNSDCGVHTVDIGRGRIRKGEEGSHFTRADSAVWSRALRRLEERGLISRHNPTDRHRTTHILLTPEGRVVAEWLSLGRGII